MTAGYNNTHPIVSAVSSSCLDKISHPRRVFNITATLDGGEWQVSNTNNYLLLSYFIDIVATKNTILR